MQTKAGRILELVVFDGWRSNGLRSILMKEAEKINSERKVVRIGNSIGVTLPPEAENIGFKEGFLWMSSLSDSMR